jgi:hypothetical protein
MKFAYSKFDFAIGERVLKNLPQANSYVVFFGGNANATASCSKLPLCEPSQKGIFLDKPHLHKPKVVLPPRSYWFPFLSTISKSPSIFIEPLLLMVSFVVGII